MNSSPPFSFALLCRYNKEASAPERRSFSLVLGGIFAAKRQPVSEDHPLFAECSNDVSIFAQSVLKDVYWPATVAWLCRNHEFREAFVSVCGFFPEGLITAKLVKERQEASVCISNSRQYEICNMNVTPSSPSRTKRGIERSEAEREVNI